MENSLVLKMSRDDSKNWYHGKISRETAEKLLKKEATENGTFLVRESNTATGDYVLSVYHVDDVFHYQIRKHGEDAFFSVDEQTIIHGLDTLIEYYQEDAHDLVTKLTSICKCEAPPHDSCRHGRTNLLHRATKEGNYTVVSELLKCGYRNLEAKNQEGQTAVHLASRMGKDDILKKLIDSGANVNCRDSARNTPLHYACQSNLPSTVQLLVLGGANIQARNPETGWVPLHEAASRGYCEVVRILLALDAPVRPRTLNENLIPADLALRNQHHECARILREYKRPASKAKREQWYHGTLDRSEATAFLTGAPDGSFLIRYSDRNGGAYVLTMLHDQQTFNFMIRKQGEFLFIDDGPYLESLEHIVEFYSCMADGLPTALQHPIPPRPKPPLPEFSTMPRPNKRGLSKANPTQFSSCHTSPENIRKGSLPLPLPVLTNVESCNLSNANFGTSMPSLNSRKFQQPIMNNNNNNYEKPVDVLIPREYLELGDIIGEGEFASVHRGIYLESGKCSIDVAIKKLHDEHNDADKEAFLREAKVMMQLRHHCVVTLLGISHGSSLLMVQEFVPLGSMLSYLISYEDRINPNYELKLWASQIACGMKYLEEQRFIHRDLAARNILLASQHQAKISDFGLSRALETERQYYRAAKGGKWPLRWYAPESYNYGTFSHKSDVWSFGILLWEMFSFGQQPYGDRKGVEVIKAIDNGERLAQPERCPDKVYRIMEECWAYDPDQRPDFTTLLEVFSSDPDYINIKEKCHQCL